MNQTFRHFAGALPRTLLSSYCVPQFRAVRQDALQPTPPLGVRGHEPEHGVGAPEGPVDDTDVAQQLIGDADAVGRSREFRLGSKHVDVVGAFAGRAQATYAAT
jgi:hypothetical protein